MAHDHGDENDFRDGARNAAGYLNEHPRAYAERKERSEHYQGQATAGPLKISPIERAPIPARPTIFDRVHKELITARENRSRVEAATRLQQIADTNPQLIQAIDDLITLGILGRW